MKKILVSISTVAIVAIVAVTATRAYFSSTATSTGNTFTAGTLEFNIKSPDTTGHQVFDVSNMKPGDVVTKYIVVTNEGSLDQKWKAWVNKTSGTLDGALNIKITMRPSGYSDYASLTGAGYTIAGPVDHLITDYTPISNLYDNPNTIMLWDTPSGPFSPKWAAVYELDVQMDPGAGNTYQEATFSGDINFYATQFEVAGW